MPRHLIALALIKLSGKPIAAPSANASTKPSPTAAEHVAYDLDGRIETIIDGGDCDVGVESTVVDGLSQPPQILRPGGISLEQLRSCPGWEETQIGYKNTSESGTQPKAPGMKYRHYAPKATVVLYESGRGPPSAAELLELAGSSGRVGVVRTKTWSLDQTSDALPLVVQHNGQGTNGVNGVENERLPKPGFAGMLEALHHSPEPRKAIQHFHVSKVQGQLNVFDVRLGPDIAGIARGIFGSLRALDRENVDAIIVEGISDDEGETAAAIMNRLRKAAEVKVAT